ncbi:MAG TPA: AsmA family protein [Verrucomicrobiae bacterium]|nr:AsmA family protein [Verrucomicrobiae bacterium]
MKSHRAWYWLGGVLAAFAILALIFDSNWLKGPIERMVTAKTGREFRIEGNLDIIPRLTPRLTVERVRFANPPWAQEPETLRLEKAEISLALLPLLRGKIVLPQVALTKPVIALERNEAGANNWTLGRADAEDPEQRGEPPQIGLLTVDEGVLLFHDAAQKTSLNVQVQTVADGESGRSLKVALQGTWHGQRVVAEARGGPMLALADTETPYPLEARFAIGKLDGHVAGTVTGLVALAAADLKLEARGESLSELYALTGVALPPTPPYRISGQLIREAAWWRFHDFDGHVGDSDLAGSADVLMREGERIRLEATLTSQVLDIDDLGGFIGANPQTGPGETASAAQARQAAAKEASPRMLPDVPLKLDRLRAMDADVRFAGRSIRGAKRLDDLDMHLVLKDGVMTLKPLKFGVAGGKVVSTLALDGRGNKAGLDGEFEFRRIDLRKLFPENRTVAKSTGLIGGRAAIKGEGNSLAEVLGDADGSLGLAMTGGQVSNLVLELAGLDAAEALRLLFTGDKPVQIRCAVADVEIRDGMLQTRSVVVDTTDTNLNVEGRINLGSEELDLTLHPLPKDYSLAVLRTPLHLSGTFKDLAIRPDKKLLVRGGIAAILGAIAGPAGVLVAMLESGPGEDADCGRLIAAAQRHAAAPAAAGSP